MVGVPSTGKTGIGVLLQVADGESPATWATIANITNLSGGGATTNMVDSTHLNSPDFYAEKTPGLKTANDWTFTVQWDPTDPTLGEDSGLAKFQDDRSLETFRINPFQIGVFIGIECTAYVSELGNIEITPEGLMTQSGTLSVKGKPRQVVVSAVAT